jgi:SAM-dependent methyltransferase
VSASIIYKSEFLYELAMILIYGRHYPTRYRALTELIPDNSSVLDLCCGPALLYHRYLRSKSVKYIGLDINEKFIDRLRKRGADGRVWDLRSTEKLPGADYVVMQASLYHFLPDPGSIVDRMLAAARRQVIIAEPIRNLTDSDSRMLASLGRLFTNPGTGTAELRYNEASLAKFFSAYSSRIIQSFSIAGGREKVYVLSPHE